MEMTLTDEDSGIQAGREERDVNKEEHDAHGLARFSIETFGNDDGLADESTSTAGNTGQQELSSSNSLNQISADDIAENRV
jgi:hypothetical protein